MESVQVELPDRLAQELDTMVQAGWFNSKAEVVRLALLEFIRHHRLELLGQFQWEDIAWALQQRKAKNHFKLDWRGSMRDLKDQYTSVELQHNTLKWWDD